MKRPLLFVCLALVGCGLFLAGCQEKPAADSGARSLDLPSNVTAYAVKGVIREIMDEGRRARIAHEEIPGYMKAMTMVLDLKDTNELAGIHAGDYVSFRMLVTESDGWIDQVKKIGESNLVTSATETSMAPDELEELSPGDLLPDCSLVNQDGQSFQLSAFKGQAFAFTFIFTRCPFPVYCPRMTTQFAEAQQTLLADETATNWHLLSISFDPAHDTPALLKQYAERHQFNPARWTFATGQTEAIRQLGQGFGLMFREVNGSFDHNVRTVIANPQGKIHKVFYDNQWKPEELVAELKQAMAAP